MRYLFAAPLLAAIPGIAFAGPLTFEAALQRARQEAPSLKAKVLGADAARSARGAAGPLPDPTLGVSVESFPISGPLAFEPQRDDFTMARVGVSQDIPNLATRHAQQARADSDIKVVERTEERRGGKECGSTCRYRWSPDHTKNKKQQ